MTTAFDDFDLGQEVEDAIAEKGRAAVRDLLQFAFESFRDVGAWGFTDGGELLWEPDRDNNQTMWDLEFPIRIAASPASLISGVAETIRLYSDDDDRLPQETRAGLLEGLAMWRAAIDEAEAAVKAAP